MLELEQLFESLQGITRHSLPPIERWQPERQADIDICIRSDGRWWHEGSEIKRHELIKLFASILRRESSGSYYLVTPNEKLQIQVEDVPLLIVESTRHVPENGTEQIAMRSNLDDVLTLGADHALELRQSIPYVYVRRGLWARVTRNVYYQWADWGQPVQEAGKTALVLQSGGEQFSLGDL